MDVVTAHKTDGVTKSLRYFKIGMVSQLIFALVLDIMSAQRCQPGEKGPRWNLPLNGIAGKVRPSVHGGLFHMLTSWYSMLESIVRSILLSQCASSCSIFRCIAQLR